MRKLILNLHMYGGLLCFSYLIIFGLSSLHFNHPYDFTRRAGASTSWERTIHLPPLLRLTKEMTEQQLIAAKAEANHVIRQALGLFGHQRPWESWWDNKDPNHYHASLIRPGREYEVDVHLDRNLAQVRETRRNFSTVLGGLHGFHESMPGSAFVSTWSWYTEFCTFFVIFAGISGVYLWTFRRNERRIGYVLIGAAAAFSFALMLYLTLHG